jgi:hypothetical protein
VRQWIGSEGMPAFRGSATFSRAASVAGFNRRHRKETGKPDQQAKPEEAPPRTPRCALRCGRAGDYVGELA